MLQRRGHCRWPLRKKEGRKAGRKAVRNTGLLDLDKRQSQTKGPVFDKNVITSYSSTPGIKNII